MEADLALHETWDEAGEGWVCGDYLAIAGDHMAHWRSGRAWDFFLWDYFANGSKMLARYIIERKRLAP